MFTSPSERDTWFKDVKNQKKLIQQKQYEQQFGKKKKKYKKPFMFFNFSLSLF